MSLKLNTSIMKNIFEYKNFYAEAYELINYLMDKELEKADDEIDFEFIDSCSNALIELNLNNENAVLEFITSSKTINKTSAIGWKNINKGLRVLIVAAVIFATTISANAAVGSITGKTIVETIVSYVNSEEKIADEEESIENDVDADIEERTTESNVITTNAAEVTYKAKYQEVVQEEERNLASKTTISNNGTHEMAQTDDKTNYIEQSELDENYSVSVEYIHIALIKSQFKRDYEIGESFNSKGLYVTAHYSNGNNVNVPIKECKMTGFDTSTSGAKTVTLSYKGCCDSFSINVKEMSTTQAEKITVEE